MQQPAKYVAFNSIRDNPAIGDERNFVHAAEMGGRFSDLVSVSAGKEYEVYIGYHNNAASNYNALGTGTALGAKAAVILSGLVSADCRGGVSARIFAENAQPKEIWDGAAFTTDSQTALRLVYVPGSAVIHCSGAVNGSILSDDIMDWNKGTFIGYDKLDGILPGCSEYSGHIILRLRAENA